MDSGDDPGGSGDDASRRRRVLAETTRVFGAAPLDVAAALGTIAREVVRHIGDTCSIALMSDDGTHLEPRALHSRDPEFARSAAASLDTTPVRLGERIPGCVAATGRALRVPVFDCAAVLAGSPPAHRAHLERFPIFSLVAAPIRVAAAVLGVIVLTRAVADRPYTADDELLLQDLADSAGLLLSHARLYEAERDGRERLARLQAVTSALAEAMTPEAVARIVVEEGCRTIVAATALCYLAADDGALRLVAARGVPDEFLTRDLREIPPGSPLPAALALRTGDSLWVEDSAQYERLSPALAERARAAGRMHAFTAVPLQADGVRLGVVAFGFVGEHRFAETERAFITMLAHHCAQALQRARLVERERRHHERASVLAAAGELLATSLDYETTLANVVRTAMPALADFCFLDIVEPGAVRRLPGAHDDEPTLALLRQTQWVRSERTDMNLCALSSGRTGRHPDIDDAWMQAVAVGPEHLELLRQLRLRSLITVPLISQGELLGSLTLCHGRSGRRHSPDDTTLAEELARRAAQAVRHARLLIAAERAARQAEAANRLKDEFLATVSHELRTPLSAIFGWVSLLHHERHADPALVQRGLAVIDRNVRAQLRLVEDILDVSRIVRGGLRLDAAGVDLEPLAREVLDSVRPAADAREIALSLVGADVPCRLVGDEGRLRQILWNLLNNAVKFTPAGGRVTLTLARSAARATLIVQDTGIGIDPAFLPHVFEPFRQADGSSTRAYGGLGLGLAIVRHLAEAHGGSVRADSPGPGRGATFTVELPLGPFTASAPTTAPDSVHPGELAGLRLLVVEDDDDSRELIALFLAGRGAAVRTAASAEEALAAVRSDAPDLLVSDIGMPGRDGFWLIEQVRAVSPALPAIALTAYARRDDVERTLAAGFLHHVPKPVDPQRLADLIARHRPCC